MTEPTRAELEQVATQHLNWLEHYVEKRSNLLVSGINILQAFTYDLIQLLNHQYLRERLEKQDG